MENIQFEGVNLAELLPRIPDSVKNGLPFGIVKMDLKGTILEYNMAEGELTGVDPKWAIGKNFFDDVAMCTKTQAFYGRFVEGVKKGFFNIVFEYVFDHQQVANKVKVHMFTMPDSMGKKTVMLLVKRAHQPVVVDAVAEQSMAALNAPAVQSAVHALMAAMNETPAEPLTPAASTRLLPEPSLIKSSGHEDIFKL
jgi:photoactive yellow protein